MDGDKLQPAAAESPPEPIIAYDAAWQFPAITEQHAYHRIKETVRVPAGVTYVAFPWATLIDKIQSKAADMSDFLEEFRKFCARIPRDTIKVTVCQQIYLRDYLHYFGEAQIDYIFWSHATTQDALEASTGTAHPALLPFPLYPVQLADGSAASTQEADGAARKYLYSFIGARADENYPRKTRNWILEHMSDDPRGFVAGRDSWFYEKIVYDHQVHGRAEPQSVAQAPAALIEQDKAREFRRVLEQSVFALCPAGTGPNSIRLWEALGAGAVPVILADEWSPPSHRALWDAACLFRPETQAAVHSLGDELESLERQPELIAEMRQAMRQLWMLYGPGGFVHDIHKLLQGLPSNETVTPPEISAQEALNQARGTLTHLAGEMLLARLSERPSDTANEILADNAARALRVLQEDDPARRHFEAVADFAQVTIAPAASAPGIAREAIPKVHLFGRHSNRTPLSYEPILREIAGQLEFVDAPERADILVTGFNLDFIDAQNTLYELQTANPHLKMMVLSEEPLWDGQWTNDLREAERWLDCGLSYRVFNHANCGLFDFERVPYFPLTDDDFAATYAAQIHARSQKTPDALLDAWEHCPIPAAFFAEHRDSAEFDHAVPDIDVLGLSNYRTTLARHVRGRLDGAMCVGKGWGEQHRRQAHASWHSDKLATLSDRALIVSGLENTHHPLYVTEKLFDCFAVGAIPIYFARPGHRAVELVSEEAMINVAGLDPDAAAELVIGFKPDRAFAQCWLDTARNLAKLMGDVGILRAERRRIAHGAISAITETLDG